MWSFPWRYREGFAVAAGLAAVGFLLQLTVGPFDFYLLRQPVNYLTAGVILGLAALSLLAPKNRIIQWLSGGPLAVALITGLLLLSLIMGLTPQLRVTPPDGDIFIRLGWAGVTSSWPFVLIYLVTLLSLALAVARRLKRPRRNLVFLLNHAGLWLLLAAAGLGAADRERHVMHVREGEVEWRVYDDRNEVLELPLAVRLDDFDLEEYPPKLAVIDRATGRPLPEGRADWYQIDPEKPEGRLGDWEIKLQQYIHQALPAGNGDWQESPRPESAQAARVMARNTATAEMRQGWVSAGNSRIPPAYLMLDDNRVLVMSRPEPKRFTSAIKVYTREGREREARVEVNKPLAIGQWMIYQHSYDDQAGRMSDYSGFELVYDPGLPFVHAGLILMTLGAVGLIWQGRSRPTNKRASATANDQDAAPAERISQ